MIAGHVTSRLEARIPLFVEDNQGQAFSLEAIVDTGFSEFLTLPTAMIAVLGLSWIGDEPVVLGDGTTVMLRTYSCALLWDGQPKAIQAFAVGGKSPLVGMKLLAGYEVRIRVVDTGSVWIDLVP